jgi:hypothetical protein
MARSGAEATGELPAGRAVGQPTPERSVAVAGPLNPTIAELTQVTEQEVEKYTAAHRPITIPKSVS